MIFECKGITTRKDPKTGKEYKTYFVLSNGCQGITGHIGELALPVSLQQGVPPMVVGKKYDAAYYFSPECIADNFMYSTQH